MAEPVRDQESTPDTAADLAWLAAHPGTRWTLYVTKRALVPLLVIVLPLYFNYRIERDKLKAADGYGETARAIKKLQADVAALNAQMEPTQQLALAQSVRPQPVAPAATVDANLALEQYKKALVVKVQRSQGHAAPAAPLPARLDDVPAVGR